MLETREIRRVGSNAWVPVDVRFIAATHRDLRAEVNAGRFPEQEPIVFTAHSDGPTRGFWNGIFFYSQALPTSRLSHARVEYAGGYSDRTEKGSVVVIKDKGAIANNTRLSHSGLCGIVRAKTSSEEPFTTDFTAAELGNTFEDNLGSNQCGP